MLSWHVSRLIPVDIFLRKAVCHWSNALLVEQLLSRSPRRENVRLKQNLSRGMWVMIIAAYLDTSLRLVFWKPDLPSGRTCCCRQLLFVQGRRLIKMSASSKREDWRLLHANWTGMVPDMNDGVRVGRWCKLAKSRRARACKPTRARFSWLDQVQLNLHYFLNVFFITVYSIFLSYSIIQL